MKIRLNKVQKELNLGLSTIVEFLQKKGFDIKEDPNAVVPEDGYQMLIEEFSADKKARMQSDSFTQERKNKEKPKSTPTVEEKPAVAEAPKVVEVAKEPVKVAPKKEEPTIKITGKIDLDAINKKNQPKKLNRFWTVWALKERLTLMNAISTLNGQTALGLLMA